MLAALFLFASLAQAVPTVTPTPTPYVIEVPVDSTGLAPDLDLKGVVCSIVYAKDRKTCLIFVKSSKTKLKGTAKKKTDFLAAGGADIEKATERLDLPDYIPTATPTP